MARQSIPVSRYEYHRLNERFYEMEPYEYLDGRLRSLILTISDTVDHDAIWASEVGYQDLKVASVTTDRKQLDRYAAVESTVLLHHSCETLLRLYLAHANRTECPWLEMSSLINAREFKETIRKLGRELNEPTREADILEVFSYTSDPKHFSEMTETVWNSHRKAMVRLLRFAIEEVAGVANAYNAAKHGLAIGAGPLNFSFGPTGGEMKLMQAGPALNYLEMAGDKGKRRWQVTSRWVDPERNLGIIALVKQQIEDLWGVARLVRHIDKEPKGIHLLQFEQVEGLLTPKAGFGLIAMSDHVAWPDDDELAEA